MLSYSFRCTSPQPKNEIFLQKLESRYNFTRPRPEGKDKVFLQKLNDDGAIQEEQDIEELLADVLVLDNVPLDGAENKYSILRKLRYFIEDKNIKLKRSQLKEL